MATNDRNDTIEPLYQKFCYFKAGDGLVLNRDLRLVTIDASVARMHRIPEDRVKQITDQIASFLTDESLTEALTGLTMASSLLRYQFSAFKSVILLNLNSVSVTMSSELLYPVMEALNTIS
jgi:hypothetical protein